MYLDASPQFHLMYYYYYYYYYHHYHFLRTKVLPRFSKIYTLDEMKVLHKEIILLVLSLPSLLLPSLLFPSLLLPSLL
jgi:hypothetical protein